MNQERRRNVEALLNQLAKGRSHDAVLKLAEIMDDRAESQKGAHDRGVSSEVHARSAIAKVPTVAKAILTTRNGNMDMSGTDILVRLHKGEPNIRFVNVQVKSSEHAIEETRKMLCEREGVTDDELNAWLTKRKWIIINGQLTRQEIQQQFLADLARIREYQAVVLEQRQEQVALEQSQEHVVHVASLESPLDDVDRQARKELGDRLTEQRMGGVAYEFITIDTVVTCIALLDIGGNVLKVDVSGPSRENLKNTAAAILLEEVKNRGLLD